jgi:UDP-3-O-[3-hydroxymyristoyl] glucosamine N-acyltransferase
MKIVIIGAGSTAKVVFEILSQSHEYDVVGFIGNENDTLSVNQKKRSLPIPYLGERHILSQLKTQDIYGFIVAVGDNLARERIFYEAVNSDLKPINAISNQAIIENTSIINSGSIIKAGAIISHNTVIGSNCLIENGVIVEANCKVLNNCNLESGSIIGSSSLISKNVVLGMRSVVPKQSTIGKNQIIKSNQIVDKILPDLFRNEDNA